MIRICICFLIVPAISIIVKDPSPPNEYNYSYDIQDPTTGDTKSQQEVRKGDTVTGSYSVLDPDGTKRTVTYTADPINGFQATVLSEPVYEFNLKYPVKNQVPVEYSTKLIDDEAYSPLYTSAGPSNPYNIIQDNFFVPANEIVPEEGASFGHGEYFNPANIRGV